MQNERPEKDETSGSRDPAGPCGDRIREEHDAPKLKRTLSAIRHKIFILSGKGGVGKTTVAVNLAVSLAAQGYRTGLLDIDIHGPNVPKMLGLDGWTLSTDVQAGKIVPFRPFPRLQVISMAGFLPNADAPVIWRGPLKQAAIRQFLEDVAWGTLDFLIVDSPPGTGDEPLSVAELIPDADGAVIVTTPQELSVMDARRCIAFARNLNLPVLGVLENMSGFRCPHCGESIPLFLQGGGEKMAREMNLPFLGTLPIADGMPDHCDRGNPYVLRERNDVLIEALEQVRCRLVEAVERGKATA
jgi:ATP-binding protein involved in chromosome partitioning